MPIVETNDFAGDGVEYLVGEHEPFNFCRQSVEPIHRAALQHGALALAQIDTDIENTVLLCAG